MFEEAIDIRLQWPQQSLRNPDKTGGARLDAEVAKANAMRGDSSRCLTSLCGCRESWADMAESPGTHLAAAKLAQLPGDAPTAVPSLLNVS